MPTVEKMPAHGTMARYRIECREKKAGRGEGPCAKCRTANTARARKGRVDAEARRRRSTMKLVDSGTEVGTDSGTDVGTSEEAADEPPPPGPGRMEAAVQKDIDEFDVGVNVPMHHALSELALDSAREIDDPAASASARSAARRQLFEVLKSLRTKGEGDDNSAVAVALQASGFGTPLVP